jgi:hypothetical protein
MEGEDRSYGGAPGGGSTIEHRMHSTHFLPVATLVALFFLSGMTDAVPRAQEPAPQTPPAPQMPAPPRAKLTIDLAAGTRQTLPLDAGSYSLTLVNAIPGEQYAVTIGASALIETSVLTLPAGSAVTPFRGVTPSIQSTGADPCEPDVRRALVNLVGTSQESAVPGARRAVQVALLSCDPASGVVKVAEEVLQKTVIEVSNLPMDLAAESRRLVTIVRATTTWDVTVSSASRGRVQTMFGWTFAPNRDEEFFAEAVGDRQFVIKARAREPRSLTSLPSVFFTWLPVDQAFASVQHGPTVGLGVTVGESSARASVLAGYSVRYNQNIGVVAGLTIYPHRRLDNRYRVGQTIGENLDSDKLNRSAVKANAFFGFLMRFGADPRKAPEAPAKPAGGTHPTRP